MDSLQIAQNYFSHILNAQLVIFSVIVGALISLYFFFNYKISKSQIESGIDELKKELKDEFSILIEEKNKIISEQISTDVTRHEGMLNILSGEVYRAFGQFHDQDKVFGVAFIWWMRAAEKFFAADDENMTRITLNSAKSSIKKIDYGFQISADLVGEYQKILPNFNEGIYKVERDFLDLEFKKALAREPEPSSKKSNIV